MNRPNRIDLARLPTPLVPLPRTSAALGVEVLVKRDDLTGVELSGNKVRKLEYLMAEAVAAGADMVITCGGEQSNHARATAMAAARLGLASHLVLRTTDPDAAPATDGNILLDKLAGATIRWISRPAWADRTAILADEAARLAAAGRRPYVIPEGGSSALGSWGYVGCAEELAGDLAALPPAGRTTIVYACGSGGTGAGLELGLRTTGLDRRGVELCGMAVCDDTGYFVDVIARLTAEAAATWGTPAVPREQIRIHDGYVGLGYARSRPEELAELAALARREALVLDPVYTGKAWFGLTRELAADRARLGDRVVFLHTGGLFGLFPVAAQLADHLR